jgi:thiopeptide-type bacteriocin biosynthesis protein
VSSPWIAAHIFYYAHADGLLTECVSPLVEQMRNQGLVRRFFFIRYWENGPHIRLRLSPASPENEAEIKALVEERCHEYFQRRPALFEFDIEETAPRYRAMYEMEYGKEAYVAKYGEEPMPFYPSNSVQYLPYEQEFVRYAGPHGMDFSEGHFDVSSRLVLDTVRNCNLHVRSVLLGNSFQMILLLSNSVWQTDARVRDFLESYVAMWTGFQEKGLRPQQMLDLYDRKYDGLSDRLKKRVLHVKSLFADQAAATPIERAWLDHGREILAGITELWEQEKLELPEDSRDLDGALRYLMRSYIHMTNNRLGTTVQDEIYLCHLGKKVLESLATGEGNGQQPN